MNIKNITDNFVKRFKMSLVLVTALLLSMVFQTQAVEAQTPVQVTVNAPAEAEVGSEILASLDVDGLVNFDAADFRITYNKDFLKLKNVYYGQIGGIQVPISAANPSSDGYLIIANISGAGSASGSGYLARFKFSVLDGYGQTVNIGISDMTLSSTEAQEIPSTSIGASIKILGGTDTSTPTPTGTPASTATPAETPLSSDPPLVIIPGNSPASGSPTSAATPSATSTRNATPAPTLSTSTLPPPSTGATPASNLVSGVIHRDLVFKSNQSVVLKGYLVDMEGDSQVQVYFEWGEDTGYGNSTPSQILTSPGEFSFELTGLDPMQDYHYRIVVVRKVASYSQDFQFTLPAMVFDNEGSPAVSKQNTVQTQPTTSATSQASTVLSASSTPAAAAGSPLDWSLVGAVIGAVAVLGFLTGWMIYRRKSAK